MLSQRLPNLSSSGPIVESRQAFLQTSTSVHELAPRPLGSRLSLHTSATSLHSQPPPVTTTGHLSVRERAEALIRSSLGSSTSSTLSFLFGKRSFSSALVISGLSAAEGGNTSDTQSSSSVNIVMGPSARAAGHATRVRRLGCGRCRTGLSSRPSLLDSTHSFQNPTLHPRALKVMQVTAHCALGKPVHQPLLTLQWVAKFKHSAELWLDIVRMSPLSALEARLLPSCSHHSGLRERAKDTTPSALELNHH